ADDPVARKITDYTWRLDGAGYRDEFTSVWIVETATGKTKRITAPTYNVESAAWSPDGKHIAFVADMSPEAALEETPKVWTLPVAGNGRLASGRDLNLTNSTYGDFQAGDVLGPPPLQIIDEDKILALVAHKGETHPYRFGVRGDVEALAQPEATCVAIATGG